jgi:hypothetical protein
MKMHEAIESLLLPENKEMWIRPIVWKHWEQAYCLNRLCNGLDFVPGRGGAEPNMTYTIEFLICDWEVVRPDVVLNGG